MKADEYNGFCICVECNTKFPHKKGVPCRTQSCEACGKTLLREGSYHHQLYLQKIGDTSYENSDSNKGKCCR